MQAFAGLATVCQSLLLLLREALLLRGTKTLLQRRPWGCCCDGRTARRCRAAAAAAHQQQQQQQKQQPSVLLVLCGFCRDFAASFPSFFAATGGASELRLRYATGASLPRRCCLCLTSGLVARHSRQRASFLKKTFLLLSCAWAATAEVAAGAVANTFPETGPLYSPAVAAAAAAPAAAATGRPCRAQRGNYGCVNALVYFFRAAAAAGAAVGGSTFVACRPLSPRLPLVHSGASGDVRSALTGSGRQRVLLGAVLWRGEQKQHQRKELQHEQQEKQRCHPLQGEPWQRQERKWLPRPHPRQRHPHQQEWQVKRVQPQHEETKQKKEQQLERKKQHLQESQQERRQKNEKLRQQERQTATNEQRPRQSCGSTDNCSYLLPRAGTPVSVLQHPQSSFSCCCYTCFSKWPRSSMWQDRSTDSEPERHRKRAQVEKKRSSRRHTQMQLLAQQQRNNDNSRGYSSCNSTSSGAATSCRRATNSRDSRSSSWSNSRSTDRRRSSSRRDTSGNALDRCSVRIRGSDSCGYPRPSHCSCLTSGRVNSDARDCSWVSSSTSRGRNTVDDMRSIRDSGNKSRRRSRVPSGFLGCSIPFVKGIVLPTSKGDGSSSCGVSFVSPSATTGSSGVLAAGRESAASSRCCSAYWRPGSSFRAATSVASQGTATAGKAAVCFNWEEYCFTLLCIYGRLAEHAGLHSWGIASHPRVDYRQQQPHHPSLRREQQEPRWLWQQQQREGQVRDSRACGVCGEPLPPASTPGAQEEFFLHDLVCCGGGRNTKSSKIPGGQLDAAGATNSCASFQAAAALLPERDSSAAGSPCGWDGPSRQPFAPARGACEDDVTAAAALGQDAAAAHKQDVAAVAAGNGEYGARSLLQQRRNAREGSSYVRAPWYRLLKLKLLLVQYLRVQSAGALSSAAAAETQRRGTDSQQSVGAAAASPLPCASLVLSSAGVQGLRAQQLERHHQLADDEQQSRRLQQPDDGEKQRRRQQQDWPQEQQQQTQQQQRQQQGGEQQEGRWQQQPRQLHQPRQQEKYQAGECQQQETDLESRLLQQQRGPLAEESMQQETETAPEKQRQTDVALTCLAPTGRRACDTPSQLAAIASPLGTCEGSQTAPGFLRSNSEESAPLFSSSTSTSAASSSSGSRCCSPRPPSSPSSLSSSLSSPSPPPPPSSWCSFFSSISSFTSSSPPPLAYSVVSSGDCLLTPLVGRGALERPLPFHLLPAAVVREAAYLVAMEDTRMTMQEAVQLLCFRAQQQETEQLEKEQASGVRADIAWLSAEEKHIQQKSSSSAAARTSATGGTAAAAAANKRDAAATATAAAAAPARNAAAAATADAATAAPPAMADDAAPTAETSPFQVAVDASVSEATRTGEDYGDRKAEAAATATATDAAAFAGRRYDVRPEAHQTGSTALQLPIEKNWPSSFQDWFASASATPKTAGASQRRNLMDTAGRQLSPVAGGTLPLRTESRYPDNYSWPPSAGTTAAGAAPVGVLHQSRMPRRGVDREAWRAELALLQRLQQVQITQQDWMVLLPLLPFHFPFEAFEAKATQEELLQFYSELPRRSPTNTRRNGSSSSLEDRSRHNHTSSSSSYGSACPGSRRSTTADSQAESSIRSSSDGNDSGHEWSTRNLNSNRSGKTALLPGRIGREGSPPASAAALLAHHLRENPEKSTDPPAPAAAAAAEPASPSVGCGSLAGGEEWATSGHGETVVSTAIEVIGPAAVSRQQVGGVEASRSCSRGEEEQQQRHQESGAAKVTAGAAALQAAPPQQRSRHPVAVEEAAGAASSLLLRDQQREGRRGFAPLRGSKGDPLQESMAATVDQQHACDLQVDKKSHPVATATPACSGGSKQAGDAEEDLQQQQEEPQRMDHRKKEEEEGGLQQHCQRLKQQKRAAARLTYKEGRINAVGRGKQRRSWPPLPLLRLFAELLAVLQRRQRERLIEAQVKTLCSIERRGELDTSTSGGKEEPEGLSFDEREQVEQFFIKQRKQHGASWQETWIRLLNAAMQQHPFASPAARAAAEDAFLWLAARGEDTGSETVEEVGEDLREDAHRGCSCVRERTGCTQREEGQDGEEGGSLRFLNNEGRDEQQAAAAVKDLRIQEDRAGDGTREASRRRETAAGTHSEEEVVRDAERKKGEGEGLPEAATAQYAGGRVQAKGDDDPTYRDIVGDAVLLLRAQGDSAHGEREPRRGEEKHRIEAAYLRGDKEGNEETNAVKPEESEPLQETGGHSRAKAEVLRESVEDVREGEEQTQGDASRLTPEATTKSRRRAVLQERMGDGRRRRRGGDGEADRGGDGGEGAGALREDSEGAEGGAARAASRAQTTHDAKEVQTTEERKRRGRWAVTFGSIQEAVLHAVEGEEERSLPWLEFLYEVSKRRRRSS